MNKDLRAHIFFSDTFSSDPSQDAQRKELYTQMIGQIINESLFLFNDDYYRANIEAVQFDMLNLDYCIDLYPAVKAVVDIYNNRIILNLYTLIAANSMTILTGLLNLLSLPQKATNEEFTKKALEWANSYDNMGMIDQYIRDFSIQKDVLFVQENDKIYAKWNVDVFQKNKYSVYSYDILKLIFLHELGHWQYARFGDSMRQAYDRQAYDVLLQYYTPEYIQGNQKMFGSWIKEIIADYIALLVYTKNSRMQDGSKQCTKQCYIAIGLFYGLIAMEELGSGLYKKICHTHPPVKIRQEAAQKLYANFFSDILGIPYDMFLENEIQEWYVIQLYFSMIIDEYWRRHNE